MINIPSSSHIIVGMSGGVDSSIAAFLLKNAGYRVEGVFMKNWEEGEDAKTCPAAVDLADAEAVCETLRIPLQVVNFADRYWERVFSHFLEEYAAGRTPNPDILCNKEIKFTAFLDYARQNGADYIATGHYVRSAQNENGTQLLKGSDPSKDQSYFLAALNAKQLAHSVFPVGHLVKQEVRALAKKIGLNNHAKKDSTGICFIGERKFKNFLNAYLPAKPGVIATLSGEIIGRHDGLMFYTIGQRQGLQIGGKAGKAEAPWYVVSKNKTRNALIVVQTPDHPALFSHSLLASHLHWINQAPVFPFKTAAKIRYRQQDQSCLVEAVDDTYYRVTFTEPQRAITPGQTIVFYQDDICLGSGIIES